MATTYTSKLDILKINPDDQFADDAFNKTLDDLDNKVVGISHLTSPVHWEEWKKETEYIVGNVVRYPALTSGQYVRCTTAGTSGATAPTNNILGSEITDGTVKWLVCNLSNIEASIDKKVNITDYTEAGIIVYPTISDNGDGTISLSGGQYNFYADATGAMPLKKYSGVSQTLTLVDNSNNYVCVQVSGTTVEYVLANRTSINYRNVLPVYTVFRNGTMLEPLAWSTYAKGLASLLLKWKNRTSRFSRESGLALGETTGRTITVTSGVVWFSVDELALDAVNSSSDSVIQCVNTNGVWSYSNVTQYNNTQYNSPTGLATLTNNKYNVTWVYRDVKTNIKRLYLVLGTGDYTLATAQASGIPSTPGVIDSQCILVGRIICKKEDTVATSIESVFTSVFSGSSVTNASDVSVADSSDYFAGADVETVLQELGSTGRVSNWATNVNYRVNQTVLYDNCLYRCTTAHKSTVFSDNIANWNKIDASISNWGVNTYYPIGRIVVYNNNLFYCKTAHTSSATSMVDNLPNWDLISKIQDWTTNNSYFEGQLIIHDNKLYKVKTSFSSATFDKTKVDIVGGNNAISEWVSNTSYTTGQLLYRGNITYRVTADFTSGTTFAEDNLKEVVIGYLNDWKASTLYNVDQCVYNEKSILRCITEHTSGTNYDTNEANNWEMIATSGAVVNTWKPSTLYTANEMVIYNDTMYFANVTHTSSSTFESDMGVGNEKWRTANASSVLGEWKQVTKLNATANTVVTIIINNTYTFIAPPVEILKFVAGTANVTVNELDFDNNDATKFSIGGSPASDSPFVEFGNNKDTTKTSTGTMHLLSDIKVVQDSVETMTIEGINYGYVCKFKPIDFSSDFKSISSWEVLSNG